MKPSLTALATWLLLHAVVSAAAAKPNIVVFLSDDMNWHHPSLAGGEAQTPHLEQLAKEGTRLSTFYVQSVCSPTRAAFLTGRYPFRNGMEERSHGNDVAGMLVDERTLAQGLKEAGYDTALIGKWHLGNWHQHHLPRQRGFDYQYGLYGALVSYYGKMRAMYYDWHRNGETIRQDGYTTDLIAAECEQLIAARSKEKPLFLFVPFNAVHGPDEAPQPLVEKYEALMRERHPEMQAGLRHRTAVQYGMIEALDSALGRIVASLRTHDMLDNTLIVYFNDNGGIRENLPFRGGKGDTYDGGVRVHCLMWRPGVVPAGKTVDGLCHAVDLYPTLLLQGGGSLQQPLPLDGADLWGMITRDEPSPRSEVVLSVPGVAAGDSDTGVPAIRQGNYKLIGEELFNLQADPAETKNIASTEPQVARKLADRLQQLAGERRPPEVHTNISKLIDGPLLVFGQEENEHPPAWLADYVREHGAPKERSPEKQARKEARKEKK